ncbi:unnamed protein product [Staurois parvus]|uniref:Uncharacterized protein n=1 Tax=Staurois parvus TaxID=386267 RepID=A0ABN9B469_9NEOB|nr:unnamed protein product [Staurois parvus]
MKGPRRRRAIHKAQRFSHMRSQQSLVIPCTVCSLWSFPALCAVSGHSLHCLQSLVIPCTVSAVSGHLL